MGKNFEGVIGFDQGWVEVYKKLLAEAKKEELLNPKGHVRRIMQNDTGVMFAHAVKKALEHHGEFTSSGFAKQSSKVLIETFPGKILSVSKDVLMRLKARFYRSSQDYMQTFVHFGLFKQHEKGVYSLTAKGREHYDYLNNDNVEQKNEKQSSIAHLMQVYHPRWGYSEVAVYYVPWK